MDLRAELKKEIERYAEEHQGNRNDEGLRYFDRPLVGFASAKNILFEKYKRIIGPFHLTPNELLKRGAEASVHGNGTVICWVLPITEKTRMSNREQDRHPSREWAHTRDFGEQFNDQLRGMAEQFLVARGGHAVAPMLSEKFNRVDDPRIGLASTWSERHAAFAAGLGTFSINGGFITRSGIAHRIGSVVTDIVFEPSIHPYKDYRENCLTCKGTKCGVCIQRCPAGVITEEKHDKYICERYTYSPAFKKLGTRYGVSITGCGLCQTDVPCEFGIPVG